MSNLSSNFPSNFSVKNLSEFGLAAVALDLQFVELESLSIQIEKLSLETDYGMERAPELLAKFGNTGQQVAEGIQKLAKTLEQTRLHSEKAAELVAARANVVAERHKQREHMSAKFQLLAETVRQVSSSIGDLKNDPLWSNRGSEQLSAHFSERILQLDNQLSSLIEESAQLKNEAALVKMKSLEKNADSLNQTLQSARRKISALLPAQH